MTVLRMATFAAHDARTGKQLGPGRVALQNAEADAVKLTKKGTEAIAKRVGEVRG